MEVGSEVGVGGGGIDEEDMTVSWLLLLRSARGPVGTFWNLRSSCDWGGGGGGNCCRPPLGPSPRLAERSLPLSRSRSRSGCAYLS